MSEEIDAGSYEPPRQRLFAVRGATQADANEAETILAATEELMRELIERNGGIEPAAMVSCLFTTTEDLDAEFPAVAARGLGLDAVPLLCCRDTARRPRRTSTMRRASYRRPTSMLGPNAMR